MRITDTVLRNHFQEMAERVDSKFHRKALMYFGFPYNNQHNPTFDPTMLVITLKVTTKS